MNYIFHESSACNMCGSAQSKILGRRLNTPQGLRPKTKAGISVTVVRCTSCGLVYPQPLPVPANLSDHYGVPPESYWSEEYFEVSDDYFDVITGRILELNPGTRTFLDVGAGIGKTMNSVPFNAYGIEPSKPFRDRAIERMGIDPERLLLSSVEDAEFPEEFFDCISFGVVLEHLYDPSAAIAKALRWLKPGGIIYIEVPSADYLFSKLFNLYFWLARTDFVVNLSPMHSPFHLYEFTEKAFELNGRKSGYKIAHIEHYAGVTPIARTINTLLTPVMNATKTGLGLTIFLRKL